ncbi:DNA-directed RNA polymerase II subunit RPB11a, putative [Paecilomyces variotii No. 5]|uniref:DNA-directed RNA polymerase II subunit RPB11a, putative n=1 Tax=Byssochlamys spectabilis (strain No. 5 / NBRC 109023) TaxID=1356009 RepID=V5G589_BYSSN|nr:DNA-directed RNA polymerase II subunit RPB11a, putative [Paecilomyces variotii No. 5]
MSPKTPPSGSGQQYIMPTDQAYARYKWRVPPTYPPGSSIKEIGRDEQQRFESFVLGNDEKKVEVETDTRIPSSAIFTFNKEDHTLGNLIRSRLLQSSHVLFAGYKVPHPLVPKFELRVQTDGEITPKEAVITACHELVKDLGIFSREFTKEYELRKMVGTSQGQNGAPDGI